MTDKTTRSWAAYRAGKEAQRKGKKITSNPYKNPSSYASFAVGFTDSQSEKRK